MNPVASAEPISAEGVAAISGAAGAIGMATAAKFIRRGLLVVAVDRNGAALEALTARHHGWVVPVAGEISGAETLESLRRTLDELGSLHHLVAIAGGATSSELGKSGEQLDVDALRNSIEENLVATWAFTRACLPQLTRSRGDRSVVFCSSRNAIAGHGLPAYSAAKAGLLGLMHPLAVELGSYGIRVNAVAPGQIATPFAQQYHADQPGHFERIATASSLGRLATEDDVADAFVSLALDLRAVTGQTLVVDAGAHIWRSA